MGVRKTSSKVQVSKAKAWDQYLPAILFTYCEAK